MSAMPCCSNSLARFLEWSVPTSPGSKCFRRNFFPLSTRYGSISLLAQDMRLLVFRTECQVYNNLLGANRRQKKRTRRCAFFKTALSLLHNDHEVCAVTQFG